MWAGGALLRWDDPAHHAVEAATSDLTQADRAAIGDDALTRLTA
jgi:hypothetical protein